MEAIVAAAIAYVAQVTALIPTVVSDAATIASLVSGARTVLDSISAGGAVTTPEFQSLDATVTGLETTWAAELAAQTEAAPPTS